MEKHNFEILNCSYYPSHEYLQKQNWVPYYQVTLIVEAASTSETSANACQTTQCNIPQNTYIYIFLCDNLKSNRILPLFIFINNRS